MDVIVSILPLVAAIAFLLHTVRQGRGLRAQMKARAGWCEELLRAAKEGK